MRRGGFASASTEAESRLAMAFGAVAGAAKTVALRDPDMLRTIEFQDTLAGLFLGALKGLPTNQPA